MYGLPPTPLKSAIEEKNTSLLSDMVSHIVFPSDGPDSPTGISVAGHPVTGKSIGCSVPKAGHLQRHDLLSHNQFLGFTQSHSTHS